MRAALLVGSTVAAYAFQQPPRLATVEGRVTEARSDPAKPIRRALIILKQGQEPGTGAYSDDKGNYRLQVEPGAYSVNVERDGYVADPQSETKTIKVQAGQAVTDVDVELVRTGVISGRVLDAVGEPVARAGVQLRPLREKRGIVSPGAIADDRGEYRIFQIPPGKYRLAVSYQPSFQLREIKLQTPDGKPEDAYTTTYFPGTPDPAQATAIDVAAGADLAGIDIQLQRQHAVRVRGRVSGMEAAPVPVLMIGLQPVNPQFGTMRNAVVRDRNGEFELSGVLPGKYILSANAPDFTNRGSGLSTQQIVDVGLADLEGIQLTLTAPQTISGRVVAPEGRQVPTGLLVVLANREHINRQAGGLGQVGADGTFTLTNVPAGDYDFQIGSANQQPDDDLYISAIRRGDDDVLSKGLHVSGASSEPIEILLKPNGGTVAVTVHTPKGAALPEASVGLLPDPPRREQKALYATCMTDARGICTMSGVTPGDYHVFAARTQAALDLTDPDSIKDLEPRAKAVQVTEGGRNSVTVELPPDER